MGLYAIGSVDETLMLAILSAHLQTQQKVEMDSYWSYVSSDLHLYWAILRYAI